MKRKFVKILTLVIAVVLIAVVFTACEREIVYVYETANHSHSGTAQSGGGQSGGQSGGEQQSCGEQQIVDVPDDGSSYSFRVWCAEEDEDMIWDMLNTYADLHKGNNYTWKVERRGEDIVANSVLQDVEDAGDIFSFANDQLGGLIESALMPISITYNSQIENQLDVAVTACNKDGRYYAFPYSYENCFLYYNKSLVSEDQVKSLEGLLDLNLKSQYNLGIDMADSYYTTMFLYTFGVEIFGPNGNDASKIDGTLNNANALAACSYIANLGKDKKLRSIEKGDQVGALKTGNVAAMISGPHMISQFKAALGSDFAVTTLPTIKVNGTDTPLVSFSGVKMYGISNKANRSTKENNECMRIASFLANRDNQQVRLEDREFCPTDVDLFETASESGIKTVEVVVKQSEKSNLKPGIKQMANYWTPMGAFLNGVYTLDKKESDWPDGLAAIEAKLKQ